MERRNFIKLSGSTLLLLGLGPRVGRASGSSPKEGVLLVFFLRGGADGLHMVVPYREPRYRSLRGALALSEPGRGQDRPLDLGDGFALHPALSALHPLYQAGRLAIVHAIGSPHATRSHFDAQEYMESGTPGIKSTAEGWLTRACNLLPEPPSAFQSVSLTSGMPRSLAGAKHALAMTDFSMLSTGLGPLHDRIEDLYLNDATPEFAQAGEEALAAIQLFREQDPLSSAPRRGVSYPRGRNSARIRQLAAMIKANLGIRIAFLEASGWDTHFNQGAATGSMGNTMQQLGQSVAAFLEDVGPTVTVLLATEFGRTASINGSGGTDHGHGTCMMVAGRGVVGGRVHGDWPGLSPSQLYQGRDLEVTTDFRDLFAEVAESSLGIKDSGILFPGRVRRKRLGVMSARPSQS